LGSLQQQSRTALAQVPQAAAWADQFTSGVRPSAKGFRRLAAPTIVRDAVEGIAQACVPDPDGMLGDLLVQAIGECAAWAGRNPNRGIAFDTALWETACRLTGGLPAVGHVGGTDWPIGQMGTNRLCRDPG
jgi:hypothetical protein